MLRFDSADLRNPNYSNHWYVVCMNAPYLAQSRMSLKTMQNVCPSSSTKVASTGLLTKGS